MIGCTSLATLTAARFYLLLIPLVLPVCYWVPCTRYDIHGVHVDQDARHWPVYDHKAGGGYQRQEKGVNCEDLGSHQETKKSIGRVYTK